MQHATFYGWVAEIRNTIFFLKTAEKALVFLQRSYYAQRWGELLQSKFLFLWEDNLQLGNRPFYVPPSPVIGCHWSCVRGKRLHGSFPDFPGDFFSHCILRLWRSNRCATVGFLKNCIRFINVPSAHICSTAQLLLLDDKRSNFFHGSDLSVCAQQLRASPQLYPKNTIHAARRWSSHNNHGLPPGYRWALCVITGFIYACVCACVCLHVKFDSFLFH